MSTAFLIRSAIAATLCVGAAGGAHAQEGLRASTDHWQLQIAPTTMHWSHDPEHKRVFLVALEQHRSDETFRGLSLFSNSFGQPSAYAYYGWEWNNLLNMPSVYARLTVGV